MPTIQMSLLTAIPARVGQKLPGSWRDGVRRYMVISAPLKKVRTNPAILLGIGAISKAPVTISPMANIRRNLAGGTSRRNG